MTKDETVKFWKQQIQDNDRWATQALLRIYQQQTEAEKTYHTTVESNKVGFTAYDADILSSMAEFVKAHGRLTNKQLAIVQRKMPKYAGQLFRLTEQRNQSQKTAKPARRQYNSVGAGAWS